MSLSIQTNVNALVAQQNLSVNNQFQSRTIQRLTSGYRINSSADDAAGLAVANKFRSDTTELTQGVRNANDGLSQLQIMDGGLTQISQMLDRMKTLATESASATFTGDRTTLNNEYQSLITEINRQAANIGLNNGGTNNKALTIYLGGGGSNQNNAQVTVDLSGATSRVDAAGLGVGSTNLLGAGTDINHFTNLNVTNTGLLAGSATEAVVLQLAGGASFTATVTGTAGGITATQALQQINSVFAGHGVTASINNTTGALMFSGSVAFTVSDAGPTGGTGLNDGLGTASTAENTALFNSNGAASFTGLGAANHEDLAFTVGGATQTVVLNAGNAGSTGAAVATLNGALSGMGIYAVVNQAGTGIDFQSNSSFTVAKAATSSAVAGVYAAVNGGKVVNAPTTTGTATGNSLSAITLVSSAVSALGLVQGHVGAGQNMLNYAIGLAQSQITNFSSAEAQIRDADVASEAANLTKAQVLQQASIAAMAQANSAPQAVLSLLKG